MADVKITALAVLTAADPINDAIPIVDVSDISMAASGTTKRISVNNILGASGTATLASATITGAATVGTTLGVTGVSTLASAVVTGDLTVDTSTLKVDSTNDRVGIGTATPGRPLEVYNTTESTVWAKTTTGISLFRSGGTSGDFYFGIDNSTAGGFGQGNYSRLIYSNGAYPIVFSTNATERARFNSTGNLAFANGLGIDFSAVTGGTGTATANVLNDYEEGTWVPTQGSGLVVVGAFSSSGTYTKVGRLVTIVGRVNGATSVAATSGNILCSGLPFTASDQAGATAFAGAFTSGAFCAINVTDLASMTAFGPTASIRFSATYQV